MIGLAGWGNYPRISTGLLAPRTPAGVPELFEERSGLIARGNGRAYGDAAIGAQFTLSSLGLNRMRVELDLTQFRKPLATARDGQQDLFG